MKSPVKIFIDTEFTNFVDMDLISIALVTGSENGREFYAEVSLDETKVKYSDFVRITVLPSLEKTAACNLQELKFKLEDWLSQFGHDQYVILYDYFGDFALFMDVLGYEPSNCRSNNIKGRIDDAIREQYFGRPGIIRHHALHDARALAYAYEMSNDHA